MATVPTKSQIQYEQAHIDETLVSGLLASGVVGITIAYIAVGLRFLCRRLGHIKHDWDDWLVLSGLVSQIVLSTWISELPYPGLSKVLTLQERY